MAYVTQDRAGTELNRPYVEDLPIHEWYRFVLSYPPHLVRDYLARFEVGEGQTVLDPYCGTGTTVVECKKRGVESVGIEPNPVVHMAASVKTDWDVDPDTLAADAERIAGAASDRLRQANGDLRTLGPEQQRLLIKNSISPAPLHKALVLRDAIQEVARPRLRRHHELALAKQLVFSYSNLRFGPEVGVSRKKEVGVSRKKKDDADVVPLWLDAVRGMADDLRGVDRPGARSRVLRGDARYACGLLEPASIDAVIDSPPYPNEKDYTRTTRLESVVLGFLSDRADLRQMKDDLMRSNTRNVYKGDSDGEWVAENDRVMDLADRIEARRLELGKTSGFEKLYHKVVRNYFGGMARHLASLRPALKPGARLAYVVGDQASFFRILSGPARSWARSGRDLGTDSTGSTCSASESRPSPATCSARRPSCLRGRADGGEPVHPSHRAHLRLICHPEPAKDLDSGSQDSSAGPGSLEVRRRDPSRAFRMTRRRG
ncbi:DNA methyltransferase [Rubrivirga sp.]|uniref:DNA methyltransferase n=1 Tax=Rubrivirga sp. TaxID=1885344 RepID=UPI003B52D523